MNDLSRKLSGPRSFTSEAEVQMRARAVFALRRLEDRIAELADRAPFALIAAHNALTKAIAEDARDEQTPEWMGEIERQADQALRAVSETLAIEILVRTARRAAVGGVPEQVDLALALENLDAARGGS